MNNRFAYANEEDKCLGLTGMIISLNVFEKDDMLLSIDIDNTEGDYIAFSPEFFFTGNPRFSAKIAWNEMLEQYQIYTALVIGNVLCRAYVGRRSQLSREAMRDLHTLVEDEGRDYCALEDDEIDMVFNKTHAYLSRIYGNPAVHSLSRGMVDVLRRRRSMSASDIFDEFNNLRRR